MEEIILSQMYFHDTFARTQTIFVYESVSIPILFHCIICLTFCRYYTVLFTLDLIFCIYII